MLPTWLPQLVSAQQPISPGSGCSLTSRPTAAIPFLPGALECSRLDVHTGGEFRNREWAGANVTYAPGIDPDVAALLFDPQTSGGLLLAASPAKAKQLVAAFERDGEPLWQIGRVKAGPPAIAVC